MAKVHRNDVASLVLSSSSSSFRLSAATFRRKLFEAIACGGSLSSCSRHSDLRPEQDPPVLVPQPRSSQQQQQLVKKKGSDKLSDLLSLSAWSDEYDKKIETLEEFKRVVRMLSSGDDGEIKLKGTCEVRSLAKEDATARCTLAMLGAIPPLIGLLDSDAHDQIIASLYALLNLAIGNDLNKAAIVKAGAVHKMLKLIELSPNGLVSEAIVANFLGLSALDSNKTIIGASGAIPFLVKVLKNSDKESCSVQARQDSLRALYNLSISHSNVSFILETDLIVFLMNVLGDMELSEKALAILSNVASTGEGRKAISSVRDAFPILVDVLNWSDSPRCQEEATYILMVMAHKAYGDRQAMIEAGVGSALLELTLLGSTLAQKRASRILECLRVDKGKQVSECYGSGISSTVSAPICGSSSTSGGPNGTDPKACLEEDEDDMMSAEKKAVKQLVQQSLQSNMNRIVKRANLPQDFVPSDHFKSLTLSSTSKSLPF